MELTYNRIDLIIARLKNKGYRVKYTGKNSYMAQCPCHEDKEPSLAVSEGDDGRVLLKCFAGCDTEDIVKALGLSMADLFPPKEKSLKQSKPQQSEARRAYQSPTYVYTDEQGKTLFGIIRTPRKDFFAVRPDGNGGWLYGLEGVEPVPYRLPEVIKAVSEGKTVFIVEGEKDADNLRKLGLVATTNHGGAKKWRDHYSDYLVGADVVIIPDDDEPGREHAERVAQSLVGKAKSIRILELPDLPPKGDVSDWLEAGGTKEEFLALAEAAPEYEPRQELPPLQEKEDKAEDKEQETQAQKLIALAKEVELWHTSTDDCWATYAVNGHKEHWPIKRGGFRKWLTRKFYELEGKPPSAQALQDALNTLEAFAQFDGEEHELYTRLAVKDGAIYLDLANEDWEAIEITKDGWQVVKNAPVKFRRGRGVKPLSYPVKGGSIEELRRFVNVPDDDAWRLLVAFIIGVFIPYGAYPVLLLYGEQGSAKTTTSSVIKELVDPSIPLLRATPENGKDFIIAAQNSLLLAFDNVSNLPLWLSDAICRLSTGAGLGTRELYTDDEEKIFEAKRPAILNGITDIASRHDLIDRAIILTLPAIPEEKRQKEDVFWKNFNKVKPCILGALLDAVVAGLANKDKVSLTNLPRMADFAHWVVACEPALPWKSGEFMKSYRANRKEAVQAAIENDEVSSAVMRFAEQYGEWKGTATELLDKLCFIVGEKASNQKGWPKNGSILVKRLKRAANFLRANGVDIEFDIKSMSKRYIRITNIGEREDGYHAENGNEPWKLWI